MNNKFDNLAEKTGGNKYKLQLLRRIIADRDNTNKQSYTLAEIAEVINQVYDKMEKPEEISFKGMDLNEIKYIVENA